jgi:hypothetical protein
VQVSNIDRVTTAFLNKLNSLPHARKTFEGRIFAEEEDWSYEKINSYKHLFIEGSEPLLRQDDFHYSHAPCKIVTSQKFNHSSSPRDELRDLSNFCKESENDAQDFFTIKLELYSKFFPENFPRFEHLTSLKLTLFGLNDPDTSIKAYMPRLKFLAINAR